MVRRAFGAVNFVLATFVLCSALSVAQICKGPPNIVPIPKKISLANSSHPTCGTFQKNVAFNNTHYADGDGPRTAASASDCCAQCAQQDNCFAWSFQIDPNFPGVTECKWAHLTYCCWYHSDASNPVSNPDYTSAVVLDKQSELPLTPASRIVPLDSALLAHAQVLSDEIYLSSGLRIPAVSPDTPQPGDIVIAISRSLRAQEYVLNVNSANALASGGDLAGLSFATATLLQSLCVHYTNAVALPMMAVNDIPDVPFRSMLVDVARALVTSDDLREAIEFNRFYKIPYLHLHLGDDHAWTFPSAAFPDLGKDNVGFMAPCPYVYSPAELVELVAFAQARGVTLIPELEGPAHSGAMRRSAPDPFQGYGNDQPSGGGVLNVANDTTYAAMATLLDEYAAIFPSPYIHVGCDECDVDAFAQIPGYAAFIQAHGIKDAADLFAYYVKTMCDNVRALGRTPIVWQGAALDRLEAGDAIVMVWQDGGAEVAVARGLQVSNAPNDLFGMAAEYNRSLYDFGNGQPIPPTNLANMWETGWQRGQTCYSDACAQLAMQEVARNAGELWWGNSPSRPPYDQFAKALSVLEGVRTRLKFPKCEGPGPQHACGAGGHGYN